VLLLKGKHEKLWDITRDVLKEIVPAEQFAKTEAKMGSFKAAYGTVCFPPSLSSSSFSRKEERDADSRW
jgi:predicted oxidoreductase (fatty acid repression mutant protein)